LIIGGAEGVAKVIYFLGLVFFVVFSAASGFALGGRPIYLFLLVKMDANPVMAIMAGAIEARGAEK
jgi:hypothetical protein